MLDGLCQTSNFHDFNGGSQLSKFIERLAQWQERMGSFDLGTNKDRFAVIV
jgi:hypothetical protein